jgi:hypothetical protein
MITNRDDGFIVGPVGQAPDSSKRDLVIGQTVQVNPLPSPMLDSREPGLKVRGKIAAIDWSKQLVKVDLHGDAAGTTILVHIDRVTAIE